MNKIQFVNVYDLKTKTMSSMPAQELAPGMVFANILGVGKAWVDSSQVKFGSGHSHESLSPELIGKIGQIKLAMAEVRPLSMKQWIDGFRGDMNPEREIAVWMHISDAYRQVTAGKTLTLDQKKECFDAILKSSLCPREHVFEVINHEHISHELAEEAVNAYFSLQ